MKANRILTAAIVSVFATTPAHADQVFVDDLIVDGSACVGVDCVNGENFGFDTIRLKENNLRIKFQDTSSSGSFPSNDWQLTANDSANGGANKFSIDDVDGNRTPFTVEAASPNNALYIDSSGNIGMSTSSPVLNVHAVDGNSPGLRLEQDGSSGFTPQSWDLAGNETVFFVRDVTNGSKLPFKIEPNTPTNTVYLDSTGNVGLATASPAQLLHLNSSSATAGAPAIRLQNTNATNAGTWDIRLNTVGGITGATLSISDTNGSDFMQLGGDGTFTLNKPGQFTSMLITPDGDAIFHDDVTAVTFTPTSSRAVKEGFEPVDEQAILLAVADMDVSSWSFKSDRGVRHIGPVAEDFHAAFGVGRDDRHISTVDSDGVALAAIKALHHNDQSRDAELQQLKDQLAQRDRELSALLDRLAALEARIATSAP